MADASTSTASSSSYGYGGRVRTVEEAAKQKEQQRKQTRQKILNFITGKTKSATNKVSSLFSDKDSDENEIDEESEKNEGKESNKSKKEKGAVGQAVDKAGNAILTSTFGGMNPRNWVSKGPVGILSGIVIGGVSNMVMPTIVNEVKKGLGLETDDVSKATEPSKTDDVSKSTEPSKAEEDAARYNGQTAISHAEYVQQENLIAQNQAMGRDSKYLVPTAEQLENMSDMEKANLAGTLFMKMAAERGASVDDFLQYLDRMQYGAYAGVTPATNTGTSKEVRDDRALERIAEQNEMDELSAQAGIDVSVVTPDAQTVDSVDIPTVDNPSTEHHRSASIDALLAGAKSAHEQEVIDEQRKLVSGDTPSVEGSDFEKDY